MFLTSGAGSHAGVRKRKSEPIDPDGNEESKPKSVTLTMRAILGQVTPMKKPCRETAGNFRGYIGVIGYILGFYRDNGKENGNYYNSII